MTGTYLPHRCVNRLDNGAVRSRCVHGRRWVVCAVWGRVLPSLIRRPVTPPVSPASVRCGD